MGDQGMRKNNHGHMYDIGVSRAFTFEGYVLGITCLRAIAYRQAQISASKVSPRDAEKPFMDGP